VPRQATFALAVISIDLARLPTSGYRRSLAGHHPTEAPEPGKRVTGSVTCQNPGVEIQRLTQTEAVEAAERPARKQSTP
jgi:hypothetical protein